MRNNKYQANVLLLFIFVFLVQAGCKTNSSTLSIPVKKADIISDSLLWITMIDSPGVNYYKVVESFEKFWEHRQKPTEADGEGKDIFGKEKVKDEKDNNRPVQYVYEYKRFLNWQQRNKNLVKPDSTIMTPEEVLEQWKKSDNNIPSR
jgi:hypothetical protein